MDYPLIEIEVAHWMTRLEAAVQSNGSLSWKTPFDMPTTFFRPCQVDVARLRKRMRMTQKQFCRRFAFTLATLRHWERGDRKPSGTALVLLNVVRHNPRAVVAALINTEFSDRFMRKVIREELAADREPYE
jgi:DNA-binding XRE family transcriptional regulator